jgi:ElaB/YqjD/DUF883 family membrane-anchored ribosome-binding protein
MTRSSEGAAPDMTADLAALRQDVAHLTETIGALLQGRAHGAAQHVSEAVDDVAARVASTAAGVTSRVGAAAGELEAGIERHPLTAMLISFGIGMALGLMTRARH